MWPLALFFFAVAAGTVYIKLAPYTTTMGSKKRAAIAAAREALLRATRPSASHDRVASSRGCAAVEALVAAATRRSIDCLSNSTYYITQMERVKMAVLGGTRGRGAGGTRGLGVAVVLVVVVVVVVWCVVFCCGGGVCGVVVVVVMVVVG
jgi:hypothetical protein